MKSCAFLMAFSIGAPALAGHSAYNCLEAKGDQSGLRLDCSDREAQLALAGIERLFGQGSQEEGLQLLEMLVAAKPFQTAFRASLVERKVALKKLQGIEPHVGLLVKLHPNSPAVGLLQAKTLAALGKNEEAIDLLSKRLNKHPEEVEARRLRAQLYEAVENWDQAQVEWHLIEKARVPAEERLHRIHASLKENHFEAVRQELEPLYAHNPVAMDRQLKGYLAQAYMGAKKFEQATQLWKALLEVDPDSIDARLNLAKSLVERTLYEEAALHLGRVLISNPTHSAAVYQMARLRILQERYDLAGQEMARLSQLDPGNEWTVRAQAALWGYLGENDHARATLAARSLDTRDLVPAALQVDAPPKAEASAEVVSQEGESESEPSAESEVASNDQGPLPEGAIAPTTVGEICRQHLVQKGQTLETISVHYFKKRQGWQNILYANSAAVSDPHLIREGMILRIPSSLEVGKCE